MRAASGQQLPSISIAMWYAARTAPASLRRNTGATMRETRLDSRREADAARAQSRIRCTTHLCQAAPWKTSDMARLSPSWASDVASWTPVTPLALTFLRNASHES